MSQHDCDFLGGEILLSRNSFPNDKLRRSYQSGEHGALIVDFVRKGRGAMTTTDNHHRHPEFDGFLGKIMEATRTAPEAPPPPPDALSGYDGAPDSSDNAHMSTVTHVELDAKLEAIEARADARLSRFEDRIDQAILEMRRDREELRRGLEADQQVRRDELRNLKTNLWVAAITVILGVAAFNATVLSNMVASFDSGRSTAEAVGKAGQEIEKARELLEQVQQQQQKQAGTASKQ